MLSVSSKHALRALKYLANLDRDAYYSIDTISRAVDVPAAYLAKLMKILARKKIVISKKGVGGGISLPIKRKLSFYDVCKALNDPIVEQPCFLSQKPCPTQGHCPFHQEWGKIRDQVLKFLEKSEL